MICLMASETIFVVVMYHYRRILMVKTADEFYCKMGTLSGELLNGHLFDSNGLIQKVVDLGPINDLQKMRNKHLSNLAPWKEQKGFTYVNLIYLLFA